jgi:hypothetical protein
LKKHNMEFMSHAFSNPLKVYEIEKEKLSLRKSAPNSPKGRAMQITSTLQPKLKPPGGAAA